ncbi:HYR domain-containing protein [Mariprofundus erugo]|uniref:HYR domain-containing protein n=1 Tax=Mariprofundus erugo TaxID=2528639 RepID=A0A5R9GTA3_9PROT|nr:HYR domain-containing protein [Mariprofundus erugo]TLS67312.1 HYR domain-containing protein [Mariprofundus erugo]
MRLVLSLLIIMVLSGPVKSFAATTVVADSVAANLVNRFVQNAAGVFVSLPSVVATSAANQTGLVNNTNLGNVQIAPAPAAATPVVLGATGIMLTTGNISGTGNNLATAGDADVDAQLAANAALYATTGTFDASMIQFDFTVAAGVTAVTFDLVFASNEVPLAVNPDTAVVMVDGVNYAKLSNGQLLTNQTAGLLVAAPGVVTGYTNASQVQTVTAVLNPALATHRIKIAIADNVDGLVDSAVIVSNLTTTVSAQGGMGVGDIFPPVITPGANVVMEATATLTPVNLGAPVVTDNVDLNPRATPAPAGPYPVGVTVVTWTSTDAALNVGTATQTVTITDTTPPVITPPPANGFSTASPTMNADITAYLATVTATDLVGVVLPITNNAPAGGFPIGATTVTFTAADAAGNIATATTVITVTAATVINEINAAALATRLTQFDPAITVSLPTAVTVANQTGVINTTNLGTLNVLPAPIALTLPQTGIVLTTGNITGTGGNLAPPLALPGDADVSAALTAHPSFNTTGTFDAASLQFSFTVPAGTPSISLDFIYATNEALAGVPFPDAAVIMVDGINRGVFTNGLLLSNLNGAFLTATAGTLIGGYTNVSQLQTLTAQLDPLLATHTIKITIADNSDALTDSALVLSNMRVSASTQSGMGVGDVFPPVITPAANVTMEATAALTPVNLGLPIVTDNVDPNPVATPLPLGPYPVGVTLVTWTSTDVALNVGTAIQSVTITDTTPPVLTVPANATFAATTPSGIPASNGAVATILGSATATDAVGVATISNNAPALFPVGTTTVTYTARDVTGLTSTASMNIVVTPYVPVGGVAVANGVDQIPPVIKLNGSVEDTVLQTPAAAAYVDPGATVKDNFDGPVVPSVIFGLPAIDTSIVGTTVLTYTATDAAGNSASVSRIVHVVAAVPGRDVLPPVVTPPLDIVVPAVTFAGVPKADASLAAFFAGATALDNIVGATAVTNDAPAVLPVGKTVVTFSSVDPDGNRGTSTATVYVSGITPNMGSAADADGDFIPDDWEIAMFTAPGLTAAQILAVAGPATDFDLDGILDSAERILGTNPKLANTNPSGAASDLNDVVYSNSPSDSDSDGIIDALEDNVSALDPSVVTGIPSINGASTFSINANGNAVQSVAVTLATGAPAPVNQGLGTLSYKVLTAVGATVTVRINSTVPFGTNGQFYKLDAAGNYTLIPVAYVTTVGANTIDLTLTDGGPLDQDGVANGVIVDPIAFGSAPQLIGGNGGANKAGCVIQPSASFDPVFPLLIALGFLFLGLHRQRLVSRQEGNH